MRKQIKILLISIVLILISTLPVNAANATATLSSNKTELKQGDTFIVTLKVSCDEGINGLQGTVNYDNEKLDLQSLDVGDSNWSNLGEDLDLAVIHAKSGTVTSADIIKITFKVKSAAEVGTKAKVSVSGIVLDSDAATNSTKEIGTKEVEVTIAEESELGTVTLTGIKIKNAPEKVSYKVGEKFDKAGLVVEAEYSDGTTKEVTTYTYAPAEELKLTDEEIIISYTEDDITKTAVQEITVSEKATGGESEDKKTDDTTADKPIDKAGIEKYAFIIVALITVVSIVSYKKYKQYKNI